MRIAQIASLIGATAIMTAPGLPLAAVQPPEPQSSARPDVSEDDGEVTELDAVEVTGVRMREAVRRFVADVSVTDRRRDQLGRFDRQLCSGVVNLRPEYAQVLNDRIARIAGGLRLRIGQPGCRPNVLIIFTADADVLLPILIEANPAGFAYYVEGNGDRKRALRDFMEPRPVRWWHATEVEMTEPSRSRLRAPHQTIIRRALVIVDTRMVGQVNFGALSDYIGMAALARLNPEASLEGTPTILNLFADGDISRTEMTGLTSWDVDYLHGLYEAPRLAINRRFQEGDITWNMMRRGDRRRQAAEAVETPDEAE